MCNDVPVIKALKYFGRVKTRMARMAIYYTIFQLCLSLFIAAQVGLNWWMVLIALPVFLVAYLFEVKFGITAEMDIVWRASSEWKEFKSQDAEFKKYVMEKLK